MKHFFFIGLLCTIFADSNGQVKIGGTPAAPHASSVLELDGGNNRGLLLPRMRKQDMLAIVNPAEGLTLYATDEQATYLRRQGDWVKLSGSADAFSLPYSNTFNVTSPVLELINSNSGATILAQNTANGNAIRGVASAGIAINGLCPENTGIAGFFQNNLGRALIAFGRVGFGTVNPAGMLHVDGWNSAGSTVIIDDDADPIIQLQKNNVATGFVQSVDNDVKIGTNITNISGGFMVRTNGADRLFVDNNGLAGIGGPSVGARLYVDATATTSTAMIINDQNPTLQLQSSGVNKGFLQLNGNDIRLGSNTDNTTGNVILRTSGSDRVFVSGTGNMYIGGTGEGPAGGHKLAVRGKIAATDFDVVAVAAWPDYVFANDYKLRSLEETEAYIRANKHLPNMPAAAVVEKNGFGLGDMQTRLVEKVEELTLYLIDAKKEINELKQQVQQMQVAK